MKHFPLIVLTLFVATGLKAELTGRACSQESINQCLQSDDKQLFVACLQKMYACGHYEKLINDVHSRFNDSGEEKSESQLIEENSVKGEAFDAFLYFNGAAHYGMRVRKNSPILRCQHINKSRQSLSAYLLNKSQEYNKVGSYGGSRDIDWVIHSNRILAEIDRENICFSESLTTQEARKIANEDAKELVSSFFLNSTTETASGDAIKQSKSEFTTTVKDLINNASDIETRSEIKNVELEANKERAASILSRFKNIQANIDLHIDGSKWVVGSPSFNIPKGSFECKKNTEGKIELPENACTNDEINDYKSKMNSEYIAFPDLSGLEQKEKAYFCWAQIVCEQYLDYMDKLDKNASGLKRETALKVGHSIENSGNYIINFHESLRPNKDRHSALKNLYNKLNSDGDGKISDRMKTIDQAWSGYGEKYDLCQDTDYWFCKLPKKKR